MKYCLSDRYPQIKTNCLEEIRALEGDWDIEIEEHKKSKTVSQRNWFHQLCEIFGNRVGLTKGDVKTLVKGKLLGWRMVRVAGIEFPVADGSSEDLDRLGYSMLTETLYQIAAEAGERLPEADPMRKRA